VILICGEDARKRSTPKSASPHEKSITGDVAPEDYAGVSVRLVYRTVVRGLGERASRNRSAITLSLNVTLRSWSDPLSDRLRMTAHFPC